MPDSSLPPLTDVSVDDLMDVFERHGILLRKQAAFYKATKDRKAIYVSNTKRGVTRIDISGFDMPEMRGLRKITREEAKKKRLGQVRAQINVRKVDKDQVLNIINAAAEAVASEEVEGSKFSSRGDEE